MVLHKDLTDTAIRKITTFPTTAPTQVGELVAFVGVERGALLYANGTSSADDWIVLGASIWTSSTSPGSQTPDFPSQLYRRTSDSQMFVARSTTTGDWEAISSGDGDY